MTSPRGRPPSVTRPSPASSVSRAVSRTCAPAPATAGSRPRGSRARRSSRSSRTSSASSGRVMAWSSAPSSSGAAPRPAAARGCRRARGRRGRRSCTAARRPASSTVSGLWWVSGQARIDSSCGVQPQRPGRRSLERLGHARTIPRTRSRTSAIRAASGASTLSRSSGSVLLARRLNHAPSGSSTVSPSSSSTVTPSCSSKVVAHLGHARRGVGHRGVDLPGGRVPAVGGGQLRQRAGLLPQRGEDVHGGEHARVGPPEVAEVVVRRVLAAEDRRRCGPSPP